MIFEDWWRYRDYFDAAFYLRRYPDVKQAGMNPLKHYLRHGIGEARKPMALFEPEYYLQSCPAARGAANPLLHFMQTEGRLGNPHPLFDCAAYIQANAEAGRSGVNPLEHYLRQQRAVAMGWQEEAPVDTAGHQAHKLEILDVTLNAAFWEAESGALEFRCEPQQAAFFSAMRFDQLMAQIKA